MYFLGMPSTMEWVLIAAVALLLFGGTKLPALARSLGSSVTEFKRGLKGATGELPDGTSDGAGGAGENKDRR